MSYASKRRKPSNGGTSRRKLAPVVTAHEPITLEQYRRQLRGNTADLVVVDEPLEPRPHLAPALEAATEELAQDLAGAAGITVDEARQLLAKALEGDRGEA